MWKLHILSLMLLFVFLYCSWQLRMLAAQYPELSKLTSINLHPSSWIAVAWYWHPCIPNTLRLISSFYYFCRYSSYEIPSGITLKKSETAFLTFHFLSTRVKCAYLSLFPSSCYVSTTHFWYLSNFGVPGNPPHEVLPAPDKSDKNFNIYMIPPATLKLTLPAFGLATYKIRGTHLAPTEPHEIEQEANLWLAAGNWLTSLKVTLRDFQFFQSAYRRLG